jgi:hypothetical protein
MKSVQQIVSYLEFAAAIKLNNLSDGSPSIYNKAS